MSDSALPFASVTLETSQIGRMRSVTSVREAAERLVSGWPPVGRGPAYRAALIACNDALEGRPSADEARLVFIRAAQEVEIFVRAASPRRGGRAGAHNTGYRRQDERRHRPPFYGPRGGRRASPGTENRRATDGRAARLSVDLTVLATRHGLSGRLAPASPEPEKEAAATKT